MNIRGLAAVLLLSGAMTIGHLASCQADDDPKPLELIELIGREYFVDYCASCHGKDARGRGPAAAALKKMPADLTRISERRDGSFPSAQIAAFIDGRIDIEAHGSRDMPVWGRDFAEQVGSDATGDELVRGRLLVLVEYLRSIQH